ncbi:MAG: outer membrane protein assembly factor BamB [Planctomycetota bacterium]
MLPALRTFGIVATTAAAALVPAVAQRPAAELTQWPQGAGPRGDWSTDGPPTPMHFSATRDQALLWRTPLPEVGQGGIAVVGDKVFVTTMAPWDDRGLDQADAAKFAHATEKRRVVGKHLDAHCLDAASGKLLWTRRIDGTVPSIYAYPFSDATSASPVADATRVWFTNAGGTLACFTHAGDPLWQRTFAPTIEGPFNKQFEPMLVDDPARGPTAKTLIHMEAFGVGSDNQDGHPPRWHFLVGLDAGSGKELWRSEDALTHYNNPTLVMDSAGTCVLHARGGPHDVPERPVGMSLTRVVGVDAGKRVWRYEDARGNHEAALQTMVADARFAYWMLKEPRSALVLVDRTTGKEVREISLTKAVAVTAFDPAAGRYETRRDVDLDRGVFPARYSLHAAGGAVYFQCYATAWGKPTIGPAYSFGRVTIGDDAGGDRVEYLEVPTASEVDATGTQYTWRTPRQARAINSRGDEVTGDDRSRWDGWDWVFNGTPVRNGERLYFTLATGAVYVLRATDEPFDQRAFLALNDLGPAGATWTANSPSLVGGKLLHRTARDLLCFGERER